MPSTAEDMRLVVGTGGSYEQKGQVTQQQLGRQPWIRKGKARCPYGLATCPGCRFDASIAIVDDATIEARRKHSQGLAAIANRPASSIRSPAAFRQQLLMNFVNSLGWVQSLPGCYQILNRLHAWFTTGGTAMGAATDCLLLTQFAQNAQTERWRQEGLRRHSAAINILRQALCSPRAATDDDLWYATDALGVMGNVSANGCQGEDVWRQHALGLCTLLGLRGPGSVSARNRDILFNAMYVGLSANVPRRKALLFGEPRWQRALERTCPGRVWCFFHSCCRFPALLERLDALVTVNEPAEAAVALLSDLVSLQDTLQQWLLAWYKEMPGLPFRTVSITDFPSFVARHGPIAETFATAFVFPSLLEALGHLVYWNFLMFVRKAIYDLASRPYMDDFCTAQQRNQFRRNVYECADALCQVVPFYSTRTPRTREWRHGGGERAPSTIWAGRWYASEKDRFKADFCTSVLADHTIPLLAPQSRPAAESFNVSGKGILMLRLVWQDCVGPTSCACTSRSSSSSG